MPEPHETRTQEARRRAPPGSSNAWTRTRRGARSTAIPARASSWSRRPPAWSAEYMGGTWSISPRSVATPPGPRRPRAAARAARRSRVRWRRGCPSLCRGGRSPGTSLSWPWRYAVSLVASPRRMGKRPVAMGSSVPPWPTLGTRSNRRRCATTWKDVTPGPLSASRRPSGAIGTDAARVSRPRLNAAGERLPDRAEDLPSPRPAPRAGSARRRSGVPATQRGRDAGHVHLTLGSQAHLDRVRQLPEEHRDLGRPRRERG